MQTATTRCPAFNNGVYRYIKVHHPSTTHASIQAIMQIMQKIMQITLCDI